jgi:hypothetical protein
MGRQNRTADAAAITLLMTATAYRRSAELAAMLGAMSKTVNLPGSATVDGSLVRGGGMLDGMRRDRERLASQLRAHLDRSPAEQRGKVIVVLWCHAVAVVLVDAALVGSLTVSAVRIWRRRDRGWLRATVEGGAWTSVAVLVGASLVPGPVARSVLKRMATQEPDA